VAGQPQAPVAPAYGVPSLRRRPIPFEQSQQNPYDAMTQAAMDKGKQLRAAQGASEQNVADGNVNWIPNVPNVPIDNQAANENWKLESEIASCNTRTS